MTTGYRNRDRPRNLMHSAWALHQSEQLIHGNLTVHGVVIDRLIKGKRADSRILMDTLA